jgi:hypothetical protein
MNLAKRIVDVLEKNNINILSTEKQNNEYCTELEFYSNAGEDFVFCIFHDRTMKNFADMFEVYAIDFDPDEHAEIWVEARHRVSGVPSSIRALIDDADAIKETLEEVAMELNNVVYA